MKDSIDRILRKLCERVVNAEHTYIAGRDSVAENAEKTADAIAVARHLIAKQVTKLYDKNWNATPAEVAKFIEGVEE